jgi:hypothetical protein
MQMKISTNCSPLVIYFGFFFSRQNNHTPQREGADGVEREGGGWGAIRELSTWKGGRKKGQTSEHKYISVMEEHSVLRGFP